MNAQLMYEAIVLKHFQPDGLNVVKGLLLSLSRFSALIILFQENISLRCKRSCLRLVKKLTGEFMRVNELYFLIEYKILSFKEKQRCCLLADVMSVHSRNMKHAHAIEFD